MENKKIEVKEVWLKPEVKELDVNKTASGGGATGWDGSHYS